MLQHLLRWKIVLIVIAGLVLVGTIHYTSLPRTQLTFVEETFRDVLSPLQQLATRVTRSVENVVSSLVELRTIRQRNAHLENQIVELQRQVYQLDEYRRENVWLREALDFKEDVAHELLVSEVIGRAPTNWLSTVTINKGRSDGIEKGMAVVSGTGVVGFIHDVSRSTSTVLLSIDPRSAVGGLVQSSGDLVLVEGDPDNPGMMIATPLNPDTVVDPGDVILTSGLSRLFPKKIPIGEVMEVEPSNYDLSFTAYVRPFVDFTRLDYVFVVIQEEIV